MVRCAITPSGTGNRRNAGLRQGPSAHSAWEASRHLARASRAGPAAVQLKLCCSRMASRIQRAYSPMSVAMRSSAPGRMTRASSRQRRHRDQPALVVALLGPGVGKQDERAGDRGIRQPAQERAGVVGVQADVGELLALDRAQRLDDAVLERLAADQADVRVGRGPATAGARPRRSRSRATPRRRAARTARPAGPAGDRTGSARRAAVRAPAAPPAAGSACGRAAARSCAGRARRFLVHLDTRPPRLLSASAAVSYRGLSPVSSARVTPQDRGFRAWGGDRWPAAGAGSPSAPASA